MNKKVMRLSCGCTEYNDNKPITYTIDKKTYQGTFCASCIEQYKRNPDIIVHDEEDTKDE